MFNQFEAPSTAELDICEQLREKYFFADVHPSLAGLCKNPKRAEEVKVVLARTPSAGKIPAVALITLSTDEQCTRFLNGGRPIGVSAILTDIVSGLLADSEANRVLVMALDTKSYAATSLAPQVPELLDKIWEWTKLLPEAKKSHIVHLALYTNFTP